jgi:hypothetical protein
MKIPNPKRQTPNKFKIPLLNGNDAVNRVGRALCARPARGEISDRARPPSLAASASLGRLPRRSPKAEDGSARSADWFPSAPLKVSFDCIVPVEAWDLKHGIFLEVWSFGIWDLEK